MFSMFISNTATTAMMLTFLGPVFKELPEAGKGRIAMALSVPIAANIGGMGAYTGLPFVNDEDEEYALEHIMKPVAAGMSEEGIPFRGVLYGGLMKTPDGIKVIEFNCRFGDPETEVVLPALESDIYDIFLAVAEHRPIPEVKWDRRPCIGFVLALCHLKKSIEMSAVRMNSAV